jgi:cysteinyl-tRNA synthetase
MAMKYLGETIDLHGGSRDLVFPHHENELAQSEAATGCPFCLHWVEGGLVNLGGQKMSKSTGIAFNVADVRNEVDPVTLRLYLLSTHYRSPIEYGRDRLAEAGAALERIRNLLRSASHAAGARPGPPPDAADLEGLDAELRVAIDRAETGFHDALDDDFNAAGALGKLFELVREANSYVTAGLGSPRYASLLGAVRDRILAMTGLLGLDPAVGEAEDAVPAEVRELARQRDEARRARDWGRADALRDRIRAAGFAVEDRPDGPLIRPLDETADSQA